MLAASRLLHSRHHLRAGRRESGSGGDTGWRARQSAEGSERRPCVQLWLDPMCGDPRTVRPRGLADEQAVAGTCNGDGGVLHERAFAGGGCAGDREAGVGCLSATSPSLISTFLLGNPPPMLIMRPILTGKLPSMFSTTCDRRDLAHPPDRQVGQHRVMRSDFGQHLVSPSIACRQYLFRARRDRK
jgi:hypothetical protein